MYFAEADPMFAELPMMARVPEVETRNGNSITARWREWKNPPDRGSGPITRYVLYYKKIGESDWLVLPETSNRSATATDLLEETTYQFRVAPIHQSGFIGLPSPTMNVATCGRKNFTTTIQYFSIFEFSVD